MLPGHAVPQYNTQFWLGGCTSEHAYIHDEQQQLNRGLDWTTARAIYNTSMYRYLYVS